MMTLTCLEQQSACTKPLTIYWKFRKVKVDWALAQTSFKIETLQERTQYFDDFWYFNFFYLKQSLSDLLLKKYLKFIVLYYLLKRVVTLYLCKVNKVAF